MERTAADAITHEAEPHVAADGAGRIARRRLLATGVVVAATAGAASLILPARPSLAAAPRAVAAPGPRKPPIGVVYGGADIGALPIWLADRLGYFRDEGLDVRLTKVPWNAHPSAMTRLNNGDAQFITISMDMLEADFDCCEAATTRGNAVYVAAAVPVPVFSLLGARGVRDMASLRGKRVAAPGEGASAAHFDLGLALGHAALGLGDIRLQNGLPANEVLQQLRSGAVAAAMLPPPMSIRAHQMGFALLANPAAYRRPYPSAWLAADRRWLSAHRPIAVAFLRVFVRGLTAARQMPAAATAALAAATGIGQRALAAATYRECAAYFADPPLPPVPGVQSALAMIARYHPTVAAAARAARPASFVDDSVLRSVL